VTPEALNDIKVASYLSTGDDVTVKVNMDRIISWNFADSSAGKTPFPKCWWQVLSTQ